MDMQITTNSVKMENFSRDMQMVADIIGDEAVAKLITELGGVTVYIPKPQTTSVERVVEVLRLYNYDVKRASKCLGLSQSRVYTILREYRKGSLSVNS